MIQNNDPAQKTSFIVGIAGLIVVSILCSIFCLGVGLFYRTVRTALNTPKFESTSTPLPTPSSKPVYIKDEHNVSMAFIPAGEFIMGGNDADDDEKPSHKVYLDAYYMDEYEVTNALYQECVNAGVCKPPIETGSITRTKYFGTTEFEDYPVINVDWEMASAYCHWRGGELPTEAQWEKAARGTDERTYPWGEEANAIYANYNLPLGDTIAVGSYEIGASPYGLHDMAGNVWEWTSDWYDDAYNQNSAGHNPQGPVTGLYHVLRGGSWRYGKDFMRVTKRFTVDSGFKSYMDVGFRCMQNALP